MTRNSPPTYRNVDGDGKLREWCQYISPYIKNTQLFTCPSDSGVINQFANGSDAFATSYMANYRIGWDTNTSPISLAAVVAPAGTIYACDGGMMGPPPITTSSMVREGVWILIDPAIAPAWDNNWGGPNIRHSETANVGFVDGHVKAMKATWYYANTPWLNPAVGGS